MLLQNHKHLLLIINSWNSIPFILDMYVPMLLHVHKTKQCTSVILYEVFLFLLNYFSLIFLICCTQYFMCSRVKWFWHSFSTLQCYFSKFITYAINYYGWIKCLLFFYYIPLSFSFSMILKFHIFLPPVLPTFT